MPLANVSTGLVAVGSPRAPAVALVGAPVGIDYVRRYGVVEHWAGNEASGARLASISSANDMTAVNAPTSAAGLVYPTARQYTAASSQYHSLADNAAVSWGNVEAWVAATVLLDSKGAFRTIAAKRTNSGANNTEFTLVYNNSNDRFEFYIGDAVAAIAGVTANTFGAPSLATWYFLLGYRIAGTMALSVQGGAFDTASTSNVPPDTAAPFIIGAQQSTPTFFMDGRIGPVTLGKSPPLGIAALATEIRDYFWHNGVGRQWPLR